MIYRQLQVVIDMQPVFSTKANITSGVPQGSMAQALLLILRMNDLPLHNLGPSYISSLTDLLIVYMVLTHEAR